MQRIFFTILLIFSAYLFPWWFSFSLAVVALFYFDFYLEIVFVGFLIDSLYTVGSDFPFHLNLVVSFLALGLFVFAENVKPRLTFWDNKNS